MKILNYKLFEHKSGKKIKTRWTVDDAIITLYYEKFGLHRLGIIEDQIEEFVKWNIGSTEVSLIMQAAAVRWILSLNKGEQPTGLPHFSQKQKDAVLKYNKLTEPELRKVVKEILDEITDDEKLDNAIRFENKKKEEREEKKLNQPIISPLPLDRYGNPMKTLKEVEQDIKIPHQIGDIIYHRKFGKGEILNIDGNLLEIKFGSEVKFIIYDPNIFIDKIETNETPKIKQMFSDKKPKMLVDTIKPKTIRTFKDFSIKPEPQIPKNRFGRPMTKIEDIKRQNSVEIGDILNHKKFGYGEVIDINNNILTIKFKSEIKKILYNPELFN